MANTKSPSQFSAKKATGRSKLPLEAASAPAVAAITPDALFPGHEATAAAALERVRPLLAAIPAAEVVAPSLNLRVAALAALGIYGLIESLALRPRLLLQASIGELDITQLEQLPDLAWATFYTRLKVEQATALRSGAMVPAALVTRGQELRRRMLKLLDFHFEDDPQVMPKLDYIRRGAGYQDLAEDLLSLVEQYQNFQATLQLTPVHYRPSDEQDAASTAAEIIAWLGGDAAGGVGDTELLQYSDLASRAGQLLLRAYDEVAAAARYLCRKDPTLAGRFQSLYTLSRARPVAGTADEESKTDAAAPTHGTTTRQPAAAAL
jgi:hypothetical protein